MTLLAVWLSGCDTANNAGSPVIGFGMASAPQKLDPRFATDAASERINRLLYRSLVEMDTDYRPVAGLASWKKLNDRHYRFTLNADRAPFSNGEPLTSGDVAATYRSILADDSVSSLKQSLQLIERIDAVSPDVVDFHISRPDVLFPAYLMAGILPASLIEQGHDFSAHPVGSGSFIFVERPYREKLVLERRADGQRFHMLQVKDPAVRLLKLVNGEIDLLQNDLPPELMAYAEQHDDLNTETIDGENFSYIGFNLEDPVTGQPDIRRAIAMSIDRQALIRYLWKDKARPAETILSPAHWAVEAVPDPYPYNPQQAVKLLTALGYSSARPLHLEYKTSTDPLRLRLATVIQQQLFEVGIRVRIVSLDWGTFYGDIKAGRFQMYSLKWVGINSPDIYRYVFHSASLPPDGANRGRYSNVMLDELIARAETIQDIRQKAGLYEQINRILHEELPYLPLWYESQIVVSSRVVDGYSLAADGNFDGLDGVRKLQ